MVKPTTDDERRKKMDVLIEAFEVAWNRHGNAAVEEFLPDKTDPDWEQIATELLCVDFERRARSGHPPSIDQYRRVFPEILNRTESLERLAFEEYRWRTQQGEHVDKLDYVSQYQILTNHWPESTVTESNVNHSKFVAWPNVGDRFLSFEIVELVGASRLGQVYLAKQADLSDRLVILKMAPNLWAESDHLARLQHTNVVPIYSAHEQDGLQAVCMPYLGRQTLQDVMCEVAGRPDLTGYDFRRLICDGVILSSFEKPEADWKQLTEFDFEKLCVWIVSRITAGLVHAHGRGILHRDLKPANILVTEYGQPMILDFNLSEDIVAGGKESLIVGGTMPYMAPEHLKAVFSIGQIDARSDIYSVGVILFQLLTGQLPFPPQDGSVLATLSLAIAERASQTPSVRAVNSKLSSAVDSIVRRCLAPAPDERYQDASELQQDLECQLHDLPLKHASNCSIRERTRKWSRRNPKMTSKGMAAALIVVLVAAISVVTIRDRRIEKLNAQESLQQFETLVRRAQVPLSIPIENDAEMAKYWQTAENAISLFHLGAPNWQVRKPYRYLSESDRIRVREYAGELLFLMAEATKRNAHQVVEQKEYQRALERALRFNQIASDCVTQPRAALLGQRADLARQLGDLESADQCQAVAKELPTDGNMDRYASAIRLVAAKEFKAALPILTKLTREAPQHYGAWFLRGNCHYKLAAFGEADSCFTRCATLWPENHFAYFHRGVTRQQVGDYYRAANDFSTCLKLSPRQTPALVNRAIVRIKLKQYLEAINDLSLAIEQGHDPSIVFALRSRAWTALAKPIQARKDSSEALKRQPETFQGWVQRGLMLRDTDPAEALAAIDRALQLVPTSRKALRNKAHLLAVHLKKPDEAVKTLDEILLLRPDDVPALCERARLQARLARRSAALRDARRALEIDDSAHVYYQAACACAQTSASVESDAPKAVKWLESALKRNVRLANLAVEDPELKPIASREDFRRVVLEAAALLDEYEAS